MKIINWLEKNCTSLKDKTIVITGTTGGIGNEVLKHLAFLNATVVAGVRNTERAKTMLEEIKKVYPNFNATILKIDLHSVQSIKSFANEVNNLFPDGIDALINNAGVYAQQTEILESGYEKHFFVNCIAPALLSKLLTQALSKKQNSKIVFVSSISVFFTNVNPDDINSLKIKNKTKIYARSKRWLTYYAKQLALENKNSNINISIVHPGITASSLFMPKHNGIRKVLYPVLNFMMKLIFPHSKKASLSEVFALTLTTQPDDWVGPTKFFNIYGFPKIKKLKLSPEKEKIQLLCFETINKIINNI